MFRAGYSSLRRFINSRFDSFLEKRMPSHHHQRLTHRNVFILPSKFGVGFIFFLVLLFLLGTNYQNNLIIFLSYLMTSLFITAMLYSFLNISGVAITAQGHYRGMAGDDITIPITVETKRKRYAYQCHFEQSSRVFSGDIVEPQVIHLPVTFEQRGCYSLSRLTISSVYNFGLFYCWSKLKFDIGILVYPRPLTCEMATSLVVDDGANINANNSVMRSNGDEYFELKPYQQGEPLTHVAWKQAAKTGVWLTRNTHQLASNEVMLSLRDMPSVDIEIKLRQLCYLVFKCHENDKEYGVALDDRIIQPDKGQQHLAACLTALANYS